VEDRIGAAIYNSGIPLFGIAKPVRPAHFDQYLAWLSAGGHADMAYLSQPGSISKRRDPSTLMENVKSILVFGFPYPHHLNEILPLEHGAWGQLASYSACRDYHALIPALLEKIIPELLDISGGSFHYRIFTDSAPILERDIAQDAGLGWIGKNGCLISPRYGSFFFLAEMFCDLDLQPTPGFNAGYCGSCRRCIEACPTGCIQENHTMDAGRCISYLTIENKGCIPPSLRDAVGSKVFGCDICQQVCPRNQKPSNHLPLNEFREEKLPAWIDLYQTIRLTQEQFKAKYKDYPVMRAKRPGFLRNAAVAIGNACQPESVFPLKTLLENEPEILVRSHAAWALGKIATRQAAGILRQHQLVEPDADVQEEIRLALARM